MGFDKPGAAAFKIPVSDTQAYRQFGNAVVVPVAEAVARHLAPYLVQGTATGKRNAREPQKPFKPGRINTVKAQE